MKTLTLYEEIYKDLLQKIHDGTYLEGDKLPSEKEISDSYFVSRITAKKAMDMLVNGGFIRRIRGKGSFVIGNQPNHYLSNKVDSSTNTQYIGVILDSFGSSFGSNLLRGMEAACRERKVHLVLRCSSGSQKTEAKAIDEFIRLGVQGIIIMCVHAEVYNEKILELVIKHFPIVTVDRKLNGISVPVVGTDNVKAAEDLTLYLLNKGYKNIGFMSPKAFEITSLHDRWRGFQNAHNSFGIVVNNDLCLRDFRSTLPESINEKSIDDDMRQFNHFLDEHPEVEGFVVTEYNLAKIVKYCLLKRNLYKEGSIVCFDGPSLFLNKAEFTYIQQAELEIGYKSVELLFGLLQKNEMKSNYVIPHKLIEKDYYSFEIDYKKKIETLSNNNINNIVQ